MDDADRILRAAKEICRDDGRRIDVESVGELYEAEGGCVVNLQLPEDVAAEPELRTLVARLEAIVGVARVVVVLRTERA